MLFIKNKSEGKLLVFTNRWHSPHTETTPEDVYTWLYWKMIGKKKYAVAKWPAAGQFRQTAVWIYFKFY